MCLVAPAWRGWAGQAAGHKLGILARQSGCAGALPQLEGLGNSLPCGSHLRGDKQLACCAIRFQMTRKNSGQDAFVRRSRLKKYNGERFARLGRRRQGCPTLLPSPFPLSQRCGSQGTGGRWAWQAGGTRLPRRGLGDSALQHKVPWQPQLLRCRKGQQTR